jgi:hypothetical protein
MATQLAYEHLEQQMPRCVSDEILFKWSENIRERIKALSENLL